MLAHSGAVSLVDGPGDLVDGPPAALPTVTADDPAQIVSIARAYFATRSRQAAEKYFWKNSLNFYKWKKRAKNQPSL